MPAFSPLNMKINCGKEEAVRSVNQLVLSSLYNWNPLLSGFCNIEMHARRRLELEAGFARFQYVVSRCISEKSIVDNLLTLRIFTMLLLLFNIHGVFT